MWSENKSIILSKSCVILFMAALVACVVLVPMYFYNIINYRYIDAVAIAEYPALTAPAQSGDAMYAVLVAIPVMLFRITVYTGAVPAGAILALLLILLTRIGKGEVFVERNVNCLRYISWCCFIGAAICVASAFYWVPWSAVGIAAGFMGLIVRVVKNVIARAVSLQDDVDHTI